ncbi:hypothetical protein TWF718_009097 [Orbilia javanica]|uniref:3CxxC-type domain-containing protein n=1 Tax=Orbilia javanica TaxID=47235 RepID=A0AAN8MR85_9PEZI
MPPAPTPSFHKELQSMNKRTLRKLQLWKYDDRQKQQIEKERLRRTETESKAQDTLRKELAEMEESHINNLRLRRYSKNQRLLITQELSRRMGKEVATGILTEMIMVLRPNFFDQVNSSKDAHLGQDNPILDTSRKKKKGKSRKDRMEQRKKERAEERREKRREKEQNTARFTIPENLQLLSNINPSYIPPQNVETISAKQKPVAPKGKKPKPALPAHPNTTRQPPHSFQPNYHNAIFPKVNNAAFWKDLQEGHRTADTALPGIFTCCNPKCEATRGTKTVPAVIRGYYDFGALHYNVTIAHQRCGSCNSLTRMSPDDDFKREYVDKVVYQLERWNEEFEGLSRHDQGFCVGCKTRNCPKLGPVWHAGAIKEDPIWIPLGVM